MYQNILRTLKDNPDTMLHYTINTTGVEWTLDCDLPVVAEDLPVYKAQTRSIEESDAFAEEFRKIVGTEYTTISYYQEAAYPDATEELPVKSFDITDDGGRKYKVKDIMLSPVGIHLDMVFYEPDYTGGIFKDFTMSLIMEDGIELPLEDGGGGGHWTEGDKKADVDYYAELCIW